jgi:hypothetical protein
MSLEECISDKVRLAITSTSDANGVLDAVAKDAEFLSAASTDKDNRPKLILFRQRMKQLLLHCSKREN